jgi:hypothetical protein
LQTASRSVQPKLDEPGAGDGEAAAGAELEVGTAAAGEEPAVGAAAAGEKLEVEAVLLLTVTEIFRRASAAKRRSTNPLSSVGCLLKTVSPSKACPPTAAPPQPGFGPTGTSSVCPRRRCQPSARCTARAALRRIPSAGHDANPQTRSSCGKRQATGKQREVYYF